jgi:hypothetical protein
MVRAGSDGVCDDYSWVLPDPVMCDPELFLKSSAAELEIFRNPQLATRTFLKILSS